MRLVLMMIMKAALDYFLRCRVPTHKRLKKTHPLLSEGDSDFELDVWPNLDTSPR